jgi:hypothetical protein
MAKKFAANFVDPCKVYSLNSSLQSNILVLEVKPVGRETAVGRSVVTEVCLKELASYKMFQHVSIRLHSNIQALHNLRLITF